MIEVLLIADDLTGALDAVAPLIGAGVEVCTDVERGVDFSALAPATRVLSVNANTRHMDAAEAAGRVSKLVCAAVEAGIAIIVKKTDSALRGNIGAELEAALAASGAERLHLIPALPGMERVTLDGVHYIEGVPANESAFGHDPFEPVRHAAIAEIIAEQSQVALTGVRTDEPVPAASGIIAYDAQSDEDIDARLGALIADRAASNASPLVLAGCAGLTAALARVLDVPAAAEVEPRPGTGTLVFCGSVNPVSVGQCACARAAGVPTAVLSPLQMLLPDWAASRDFDSVCAEVRQALATHGAALVDASTRTRAVDRAAAGVPEDADMRALLAAHLGDILAALLASTGVENVLVMGGDILLALLESLSCARLALVAELAPGVVVSQIEVCGHAVRVVSKSGGFGERDMFLRAVHMLSGLTIEEKEIA